MDAKTFRYVLIAVAVFGFVGFVCIVGIVLVFPIRPGPQATPDPAVEVAWVDCPGGKVAMWPAPIPNAGEPFYVFHGNRAEVLERVANEHGEFKFVRAFGKTGYIESKFLTDAEPAPTNTPKPTATRPAYKRPTPSPRTVDIVDWTWYESETGNYIYVDGTIKNVSGRTMRGVKVHIELLDRSGRLLAVDSTYADPSSLGPGQRSNFKVMTANRRGLHSVSISNVTWRWAD